MTRLRGSDLCRLEHIESRYFSNAMKESSFWILPRVINSFASNSSDYVSKSWDSVFKDLSVRTLSKTNFFLSFFRGWTFNFFLLTHSISTNHSCSIDRPAGPAAFPVMLPRLMTGKICTSVLQTCWSRNLSLKVPWKCMYGHWFYKFYFISLIR